MDYTEKQQALKEMNAQLKREFFGIDDIIDKVTDSIYAWYLFPEVITRPVIINLWGMTGVGKTHLVRRISQILGFQDRFMEIQMDGTSENLGGSWISSIASALRNSTIAENAPGILLLDEFQRFRTVSLSGDDVKQSRYQDVWQLLSDGKFAADATTFAEAQSILCDMAWEADEVEDISDDVPASENKKKHRKLHLSPWEARRFKSLLRLSEDVMTIMSWEITRLRDVLVSLGTQRDAWELSYTKLLIFVSGNLDEAFSSSKHISDCDTDADIYHELTKKITVSDIKDALLKRLKPEQISRLGSNHIIYPALPKYAYQKLIQVTCDNYVSEITACSNIRFEVDPVVYQEIYDNAVYPTQGTRPVFSAIHQIFGYALNRIAVWAIEQKVPKVKLSINAKAQQLIGSDYHGKKSVVIPVELTLRKIRDKASHDFKVMVAVHESGHALIYALLTGIAPKETKINLASFAGGFMIKNGIDLEFHSEEYQYNMITTAMGGTAAEQLVFGTRSNGCGQDLYNATSVASQLVRHYGGNRYLSYVNSEIENATWNTDVEGTNASIDGLCRDGYNEAYAQLSSHVPELQSLVAALLDHGSVTCEEFRDLMAPYMPLQITTGDTEVSYSEMWENFRLKQEGALTA